MVFICLDPKVEELWAEHLYNLIKIKKEQYLLVHLIRDNYLYAIGQLVVLIRQEAKMILLFNIGINKEILGLLFH